MKTKYKFFIAKIIFRIISLFKRNFFVYCTRNKINWSLDLSEALDLSIYVFGKFEHEIVDSAIQMSLPKNQVIIDIGANIGVQTLQFANKFKKSSVISIEPTDYAYQKMKNNLKLNPNMSNRVITLQSYLSCNKNIKPSDVYSSWKLNSKKEQHLKHKGIKESLINANQSSLDKIISENRITNVSFIKLDVDGPELDVLKSGEKFLLKNKPPIFMELAPYLYPEFGYTYLDLTNYISFLGYNYYTINPIKKIENVEKYILKIKDGSSKNILIMQ